MYSTDRDNFKRYLLSFPQQIAESRDIFKKGKLKLNKDTISDILYLGMGGSAIAGDIISDILFDDLRFPLNVVRGYEIPGYCSESSLVIALSYSGNTEETLNAVQEAGKRRAQTVVITSGGHLYKLAQKNKWGVLKVPEGYPPRQAFGYLFFISYFVISQSLGLKISTEKYNYLIHQVETIIQRCDEQVAEGKVFAKDLAMRIKNKIPIIYSTSPYLSAVATRWKNQFQENAKSMAFCNVLPEMNHNEIVGWEMENKSLKEYIVLFLEYDQLNSRNKARIKFTKNIIQDRGAEVVEVYAEGSSLLEQTISLIVIADWVSYYLALLYKKNPISIINIDYLKSELKKLS